MLLNWVKLYTCIYIFINYTHHHTIQFVHVYLRRYIYIYIFKLSAKGWKPVRLGNCMAVNFHWDCIQLLTHLLTSELFLDPFKHVETFYLQTSNSITVANCFAIFISYLYSLICTFSVNCYNFIYLCFWSTTI